MLAAGAALLAAAFATGATTRAPQGGTFRITSTEIGPVDPGVGYHPVSWPLLRATCAHLLNYPDKPSPSGLRLVPEVAMGYPSVSRDGKTYTFAIRPGVRFNNGAAVTARSFARAFERALAPSMNSDGAFYLEEVVGADEVRAGRAKSPVGVAARGNRLVIRLTKPVPDFPNRMALPFFCAVPHSLPLDPEGIGAPLPSAGPYYVAEYVRGDESFSGATACTADRGRITSTASSPTAGRRARSTPSSV